MFMYNGQKKDRTGDKFSESKFFEAFFQIFPLLFRALSEKTVNIDSFLGKSSKSWQKYEYVRQKECFFYFSFEGGLFLDHFSPFPPIRLFHTARLLFLKKIPTCTSIPDSRVPKYVKRQMNFKLPSLLLFHNQFFPTY